jgi:hypothetical protein
MCRIFALGGKLEYLHPAESQHVKARAGVAFGKDDLATLDLLSHDNHGQFFQLRSRQALKQGGGGNLVNNFHRAISSLRGVNITVF